MTYSTPPLEMDYDFGAALDEFEVSDTASLPGDGFWLEDAGSKLGEIPQAVLLQPELDLSEDVVVPSPGAAGVAEMLGADLPKRSNWKDPAWVRALYELSSRGVQLASFQAWAARAVAAEESKADVCPNCPPDCGFMVKERNAGGRWKAASTEEFSFPVPPPISCLESGVDVGGESEQDEEEATLEVVTAVSLSKDASKKLWRVTSMRALARKQEEAQSSEISAS